MVLPFLQEKVLCMEKRVVGLRWGRGGNRWRRWQPYKWMEVSS